MRVIFLGPPGSGKGTQAKLLGQRQNLLHISTGDILRDAIARNTSAGRQARCFVKNGQLVPDEVVNEIIAQRFKKRDKPQRFVLDGYPRTLAQALSFDRVLEEGALPLDAVIVLAVPDADIVKRLSGRWNCPKPDCKATFHTLFKPPARPGICDECGSALMQRDDDKEETVRHRLAIFHQNNQPILEHYRRQGLLVEVPGVGDIDTIYNNVVQAVHGAVK